MEIEIDSASERGKEEIRPLEDRTRSAERYYGPTDVDDGLSLNGGPEPETEVTPVSAEEEEERPQRVLTPAGEKRKTGDAR